MKTVLILVLLGAILGAAAASLIVPPTLSWYNEAGYLSQGAQPQTLVNIPRVVRYATGRLIQGQLVGAGIGAAVFLALGLVWASRRRGRGHGGAAPTEPARPAEKG